MKADVTAPNQSQCECTYDVYAGPNNDGNGAMPINETVAKEAQWASYTGPNFTDLNAELKTDPTKAWDSVPQDIKDEVNACISGSGTSGSTTVHHGGRRHHDDDGGRRRHVDQRRLTRPERRGARVWPTRRAPRRYCDLRVEPSSEVRMDVCVFCGELVDPAAPEPTSCGSTPVARARAPRTAAPARTTPAARPTCSGAARPSSTSPPPTR